jgi:hypothetical protein
MYDFHKTRQCGKEQEFKHDLFKKGKKFNKVLQFFSYTLGSNCQKSDAKKTKSPGTSSEAPTSIGGP